MVQSLGKIVVSCNFVRHIDMYLFLLCILNICITSFNLRSVLSDVLNLCYSSGGIYDSNRP